MKTLLVTVVLGTAVVATDIGHESINDASYFLVNSMTNHNINVVIPGKVIRSAKVDEATFRKTISEYGIKTIIDLRRGGDKPEESGFSEQKVASALGAKYIPLPMVGSRADQFSRLNKLLESYKSVETPLWIHCESGTHRSGLASALWLLAQEQLPVSEAANQLSLRYGYYRFERALKTEFQGYKTLDFVLWEYQRYVDTTAAPVGIQEWLSTIQASVLQ